jgi:radical SAM protein with 4Fe4S-binding SPASM domain
LVSFLGSKEGRGESSRLAMNLNYTASRGKFYNYPVEAYTALQLVRRKLKKLVNNYNPIPQSRPTRIYIELTNRCNLNCPFCLVGQQGLQESVAHDDLNRDSGGMDVELCKKIIHDSAEFGIKELYLHFQGEPLMYRRKDFLEIVRVAKEEKLKTGIFTNGLLMNPEFSRQLVKAGMDVILFSVDGATQEIYEKNRVGGQFKKVYKNMRDIVQIAHQENSQIELAWQFIALKNNEHQIETARVMAREIGINFIVKSFAESVPELVTDDPQYHRKLEPKTCKDIYRSVYVYFDGTVVPCCYDLDGKEVLGNLKLNSLKEVWNSERYLTFRKQTNRALISPETEPELCKGCLKYTNPENLGKSRTIRRAISYLSQPFMR